jgi:hypothetical protein
MRNLGGLNKVGVRDPEVGAAHLERVLLYPTRAHKSIQSRGLVFDRALKDAALDRSSWHTCADSPRPASRDAGTTREDHGHEGAARHE